MSVKVNLLPGDVQARGRANRVRGIVAGIGVLLLLVLAGLTLLQRSAISDAEDRLADAQAANELLRADIAALQPFADLELRATTAMNTVVLAMDDEVSLAAILQDLSAVLPPTAELQSLGVSVLDTATAPAPGGERLVYGKLLATGRVLGGFAPGVERLIIDVDRVAAFDNAYVTTSAVAADGDSDGDGVVTFNLEIDLGPEILTGRYATVDAEVAP